MARRADPALHARRREQIVAGAAHAFAEKGYDGATVKDICRASGLGSGTIFHYFADKRAILHGMLEIDRDQTIADLRAIEDDDALAAFWRVIDRVTGDLRDPFAGPLAVALLGQLLVDPVVGQLLGAIDTVAHTLLSDLIARLQAEGRADPDWAPAHAATWVQSISDSLYLRCGDDGFDADAELDRLRIVLARALALSDTGS
ncbi:TetR/AcrR family transcriptional regulator [Aeromicrobium piscarium]|uniref:TetR/AcrR family transcriptional regulator n=1 Tax=Aeromicrobium piscarium TaxID=2590901 RepID=A0A554S8D6_9ACTN|nr:TetR/AcrR family transcriptional regulator [Aeromicrobium piscarium]TSD62592.1 TetR/AcrR family transcriptional regulator [Aeromicrobium piscarium]